MNLYIHYIGRKVTTPFSLKTIKMEYYKHLFLLNVILSIVWENNLIPKIVDNRLKNIIKAKYVSHRPWMKFVDKYLKILFVSPENMNSSSISYLNILIKAQKEISLNTKYTTCHITNPGLQLGIYGKICASYKQGKELKLFQKKCKPIMENQKLPCYLTSK